MKDENTPPNDFIIGRWLTGELSETEHGELMEWASVSDENQQFLDDAKKIQDGIGQLEIMEGIDSARALDKVKNRIGRESKVGLSPKVNRVKQFLVMAQRVAAVLTIPLIVYTAYLYLSSVEKEQELAQLPWVEISTPVGLRSTFELPDGTTVWLNSSTSLSYPPRFGKDERLVKLKGEAYFDVTTNPKRPFIVDAGRMQVEAVGTRFNVMAYQGGKTIEAALVEGKVNIMEEVGGKRRRVTHLKPGQLAVYTIKENKIQRLQQNLDKYIAWREGKIIYRDDTLEDVLTKLAHWYNVEFEVDPKVKKDYTYTGSFKGEDLHQILKYIELTTPVQFKVSEPEQDKDTLFRKRMIYVKQKK